MENGKIKSFGHLEVCKLAREFRKKIYELIKKLLDENYICREDYDTYRNDTFHLLKVLNGYIAKNKGVKG